MSNAIYPSDEASAPGAPHSARQRGWRGARVALSVGAVALQGACSLLIQMDDGEPDAPDASIASAPNQPGTPEPDAGAAAPLAALDAGDDAGDDAGSDGGLPSQPQPQLQPQLQPPLWLAFIEQPQAGEARLRLVDAQAALLSQAPTDAPAWRRTLLPSAQVGNVLDFAWSPDGRRIVVRHDTLAGPRLAVFTAPDWRELPIVSAGSPATQPRMTAAARYRWSPDGAALAVELASESGPYIGGYVVDDVAARELPPVAFSGPVATLDWLSPSTLLVIQSEAGEPELLELGLADGAFAPPVARALLSAFLPIELRRTRTGLIGASTDPTNFVFFWPETDAAGFETAFSPSAFLSSRDAFAAEPDDGSAVSRLFPIGDSSRVLDTLPACPLLLAWTEGPDPATLAGSTVACLNVTDAAPTLTVYSYDGVGERRARRLDDAALLADYAEPASWESHARVLAEGGSWLALSSVQHDVLVDLRAAAPVYEIRPAPTAASTARAFSPHGRFLLEQRGRQLELTILAATAEAPPLHLPLPDAALDLAPCDNARQVTSFCGSPRAAQRAAARWASSTDVASLLAAEEGLVVLAPTTDSVGFRRTPVSSCGSGCVTEYEFSP